jgi:tetratricopeptide (TPR) repeat protein
MGCGLKGLSAQTRPAKPAPSSRDSAERAFGEGVAHLVLKKDIKDAHQSFLTAIRWDGAYAPALFNAGITASALNNTEEARRWWSAYLRVDSTSQYAARARSYLNPTHPKTVREYEADLIRARQSMLEGDLKSAVVAVQASIVRDTTRWEGLAVLAQILLRTSRRREAVQALQLAWRQAPDSVRPQLRTLIHQIQVSSNDTSRVPH